MPEIQYFELLDDVYRFNRWFVLEPTATAGRTIRGTEFIRGRFVEVDGGFLCQIRSSGELLDFTFADFGVPVLRRAVAQEIHRLAPRSVQLIPVEVLGSREEFAILNVIETADCLNESQSQVTRWTEADGVPKLVGQYLSVLDPVVDPTRTNGSKIFRITGWLPSIVVDSDIALLLTGASGVIVRPMASGPLTDDARE